MADTHSTYSLQSALLRMGALLFSCGMGIGGGIYVASVFSISVWIGIVAVYLISTIVLTLLLLAEGVGSRVRRYSQWHHRPEVGNRSGISRRPFNALPGAPGARAGLAPVRREVVERRSRPFTAADEHDRGAILCEGIGQSAVYERS